MKNTSTIKRTEWATIQQVMPLVFCTSRNGVYRFAHRHRLRSTKLGGRVCFDLDEVYEAREREAKRLGL